VPPGCTRQVLSKQNGVLTVRCAMSTKSKATVGSVNFETAMERLEKIVEQMESGKLALEDVIVRYEEGMKLVKICQERLATAEQKIDIIARNSAGQPVVKPFEAPADEPKPESEKENGSDEVSLF
jgi:exodeoxyribonuclease VII small subunit